MFVCRPSQNSATNNFLHETAVNFIAESCGWFLGRQENAVLNIRIRPGATQVSEEDGVLSLNPGEELINRIAERLECRQTFEQLATSGNLKIPVLDKMVLEIRQVLQAYCQKNDILFMRKLPWPFAKPYAVTITHDVDLTRKYGPKSLAKYFLSMNRSKFRHAFNDLFYGDGSYWTFPELLDLYKKENWKATFFFLARAWEERGYRYNIQSPKFRKLLRELPEEGHEIGLHSSKFAFDYPDRIRHERMRISKVSPAPARGVRQHFLRLQFPGAWAHFRQLGFDYDSSVGFNEIPGFRAGTCFPFRAFDSRERKFIELYEMPFSIMDYPWVESSQSQEENWQSFIDITDHIKQMNGLLNILWHPSNLAEQLFRPYWDRMVEWLKGQDFYQNTLHGLLDWWQSRNAVELKEMRSTSDRLHIKLESRTTLSGLALEVISPRPLASEHQSVRVGGNENGNNIVVIEKLREGENLIELKFS
ncbi:MAG: polysaccharide deacetylase family protein [Calditrichia bacterium]